MNEDSDSGRKTPDVLVPTASLETILQQVKCPVCNEHMVLPITFCERGHNICNACRSEVDSCQICSRPFSGTRNVNLENISLWSGYPCPNLGCNVSRPIEFMSDHLAGCYYIKTHCPLNKLSTIICPWEGLLLDTLEHIKESHRSLYTEGHAFNSSSLEDSLQVISFEDEVFIYYKKFSGDRLYCAMRRFDFSPHNFMAYYVLNVHNEFEKISVSQLVRRRSEDFETIFEKGKCLKLSSKLYSRFIFGEDSKLALSVVISKDGTKKLSTAL